MNGFTGASIEESGSIRRRITKAAALFMAIAMAILWPTFSLASESGFRVESPDRPGVWYNRAGDEINRELSWDEAKQELILYIAYDRVSYTTSRDQTLYDTFQLSFPTVRLDPSTHLLYVIEKKGHRMNVGRLEGGIGCNQVALNQDVRLITDRQTGVLDAALASTRR
jgi:hypothetical protein